MFKKKKLWHVSVKITYHQIVSKNEEIVSTFNQLFWQVIIKNNIYQIKDNK